MKRTALDHLSNTKWLWKLAFAANYEFNLKLQGKTTYNITFTVVISMTTNIVWITNDVKLLYILAVLSKAKTRSEIPIPTQN